MEARSPSTAGGEARRLRSGVRALAVTRCSPRTRGARGANASPSWAVCAGASAALAAVKNKAEMEQQQVIRRATDERATAGFILVWCCPSSRLLVYSKTMSKTEDKLLIGSQILGGCIS